jgi:hypothetical protein
MPDDFYQTIEADLNDPEFLSVFQKGLKDSSFIRPRTRAGADGIPAGRQQVNGTAGSGQDWSKTSFDTFTYSLRISDQMGAV